MTVKSAGILIYRRTPDIEVLLGHMGGPFWEQRDEGAWGIPKGLVDEGESLIDAAVRECLEEVGVKADPQDLRELGSVKMKRGKEVHAWAYEVPRNFEITISSNSFNLEWPKGSGEVKSFLEVDRAEWFSIERASLKILSVQRDFLERLVKL